MHYTHLGFLERERLGVLFAQGSGIRAAARAIGREHSSIVRELKKLKTYPGGYSAILGQTYALAQRSKPRRPQKLDNPFLQRIVFAKLKLRWSPEQIAHYLKRRYAGDAHMQASHETIYTYIYLLPRGELRKELISYLRQGKRGRQRRKRSTDERGKIPNMVSIRERPRVVERRTVPGHWESDLIVGKRHASAIGTLVERTTRTTILVPLESKDAPSVRKAFARTVKRLPKELRLSLTHDRGSEMCEHELFTKDTQVQVYFADPQSPWQRGTNENTNGLIRQFFPKGTDFNTVTRQDLKRVQKLLNDRPRKVLGWRTPKEVFQKLLLTATGALRG
jgi:IS30 family transposase